MKKPHRWRVAADVPAQTRALILRLHPPRLRDIYASTITWAYGVESGYPFNPDVQDCVLYGIHRDPHTEAFVLRLGGEVYNENRLLFLTLSTAAAVKPAEAGRISQENITPIDEIYFPAQLKLYPVFQHTPQLNPTYTED